MKFKGKTWEDFLAGNCKIRCATKNEYAQFMEACETAGLEWMNGDMPTKWTYGYANKVWSTFSFGVNPTGCLGCFRSTDIPFSALLAEQPEPAPYDGRGKHKVGDLFEVVLGGEFNPGDIVRLSFDDKSECPEFERVSDGKQYFYFWHKVKPITPATRKIVITTDGRVTTARLIDGKRTIKTATATCSPSDEFSFETGARLAFDRLVLCKEQEESKTGLQLAIYHIEDALKAMK